MTPAQSHSSKANVTPTKANVTIYLPLLSICLRTCRLTPLKAIAGFLSISASKYSRLQNSQLTPMDNWQQDWFKTFETIANEVGQFFEEVAEDVGREVADAAETLFNFSEDMASEVDQALVQIDELVAPKLEQLDEQMTQWLEPMLQAILGVQTTLDQAAAPVTQTVEPWLNQHPVCVGCRNYHGQEHGGQMLVCAIHPYGVMEGSDSCPDKEPIRWSFLNDQSNDSQDGF